MNPAWAKFFAFLFPLRCVACNAHLPEGGTLCVDCLARIPLHGRSVQMPHASYTLIAATSYASPEAQMLVKALKYEGVADAASMLALVTAAAARNTLEQELLTREKWVMAPIPLHPKRERERGFNQGMRFAKALRYHEPLLHIPLVRVLSRIRYTDTQTEKPDYKARKANVAGCFEVAEPAEVRGKNVLLIDDVTTSGATLEEAARVLKRAGAHRITALVFAKA